MNCRLQKNKKNQVNVANQVYIMNLQALNLKEDEAIAVGTQAVRYLVQWLQEAQGNPTLEPTVYALLQSQIAGTSHQSDPP